MLQNRVWNASPGMAQNVGYGTPIIEHVIARLEDVLLQLVKLCCIV
jgi:hypothetical protein